MNSLGEGPITFAHPWLLLLLLLLPLLALLKGRQGAAPAVLYSSVAPLRQIGKARRSRAGVWLTTLMLLSLGLLIVALARPQQGKVFSHVEASGIDILLTLDVSKSMLAQDFSIGNERANRLEAVKQVARQFIESRPNDRIGILCFAGKPYLVSPLTLDHSWLLQNLDRVVIGLVEDGTAIGSAIASSANRIKDKESKSKIIVLLTDGDNNAGKITPTDAAKAAAAIGIKIYTICAGTRGYAPVPVFDREGNLRRFENQRVVVDETALRQIAEIGNGQFYRATDTATLTQIFEEIDKLEKSKVELSQYKQYRDLFHWPLAAGLALLAIQMIVSETVGRRLP
ncbi:MAG TPA: VWA domain-containing protein [Chthoniobacteraceae bacterium]